MRKSASCCFIIAITSILLLVFLTVNFGDNVVNAVSTALLEIDAGQKIDASDIYDNFPGMDKPYTGPLPWENDPRFFDVLTKLNKPALMAAYKATLCEPLPGEGYNVGLAARKLAGTVILPGKVFSQNQTLGPYTVKRGYRPGPTYKGNEVTTTIGGGVCKIASMLYNLATFCDFDIIERYPHSMTVPYVPPGQDATVFYGVKDFRFKNNTPGPILIWAQKVDNDLYIAFYGFAAPPNVTWHHVVLRRTGYWTEYKRNPKLPAGEERVILKGQDGLVVRSWVTVETPGGNVVIKKKGVSWYSPGPELIECSR